MLMRHSIERNRKMKREQKHDKATPRANQRERKRKREERRASHSEASRDKTSRLESKWTLTSMVKNVRLERK